MLDKSTEEPKGTVSYKDIAAAAGVTKTTVSLALRNHPRIPAKTRKRIQSAAEKLGYIPDPKIAALMRHMRSARPQTYLEPLAYIIDYPDKPHWTTETYHLRYKGACDMAEKHGYKFDVFNLQDCNMGETTLNRILINRGIRGLYIADNKVPHQHLELDWENFSAVTMGYALDTPRINRVAPHHYFSVRTTMKKLKRLGYSRIGFVMEPIANVRANKLWLAGYLTSVYINSAFVPVPVYLEELSQKTLGKWLKENQPDAVISNNHLVPQMLADLGYDSPGDIGFAHLNRYYYEGEAAGVVDDPYMLGAEATRLLIGSLHRNEMGVPENPHIVLIEGKWVDGPTLRKQCQNKTK